MIFSSYKEAVISFGKSLVDQCKKTAWIGACGAAGAIASTFHKANNLAYFTLESLGTYSATKTVCAFIAIPITCALPEDMKAIGVTKKGILKTIESGIKELVIIHSASILTATVPPEAATALIAAKVLGACGGATQIVKLCLDSRLTGLSERTDKIIKCVITAAGLGLIGAAAAVPTLSLKAGAIAVAIGGGCLFLQKKLMEEINEMHLTALATN